MLQILFKNITEEYLLTITFLTFSNSRKPWPKEQKPLLKPLSNGLLGVGYTAVALGLGNGFFYFWQPIKITVAKVHQKATALVLALGNDLHTNNA
ncbi:hypothetical protein QL285_021024 [Trifolium repens]|nr:hypothetical protein QL285_021024 [Trifolium repens]